jgi:hypothetical protein
MSAMAQVLSQFLESCQALKDGFVAIDDQSAWRLGTVLFARHGESFAHVQKAPVQSGRYEFSNLWALPGGMIRAVAGAGQAATITSLAKVSMQQRAEKEAGIPHHMTENATLCLNLGPIVTSYTASNGKLCFTLMTAQECQLDNGIALHPSDKSIKAAGWIKPPLDWESYAPANRLIIAHKLWPNLTELDKDRSRAAIQAAVNQCTQWAQSVEMSPACGPYDKPRIIQRWVNSWQ